MSRSSATRRGGICVAAVALGIMGGVLILVLVCMVLLGRKVARADGLIREKLQHGAVLEERNRIAASCTTLWNRSCWHYSAIGFGRGLLRSPARCISSARHCTQNDRHSMVEARRSCGIYDAICGTGRSALCVGQIVSPLALATELD